MGRFVVTKELVAEMVRDEPSLGTLKNQYTIDRIWELLEGKESLSNEEAVYNALIDVMYATRPKGVT